MGMLAMAMLLSHQGMVQQRGVVGVQRLAMRGRRTLMRTADCIAWGISPRDRNILHACSRLRSGARGKQSLRQAEERRRSQRLLIDHHTAGFHALDFLWED